MEQITFAGGDGQQLAGYRWLPAGEAKAAAQIAHGAAEHAKRYDRVATRLAAHGYAVYASDHRAHGRTADEFGTFGVARPGGWQAIIDDQHHLSERIRADVPGVPLFLIGHSMGSFIAQAYAQRWGDELASQISQHLGIGTQVIHLCRAFHGCFYRTWPKYSSKRRMTGAYLAYNIRWR